MLLESASLPIPSEIVLPLAGLLAAQGTLNFFAALAVGIVGSMVGSLIDYAIGYYLGKEVVYKHLAIFHIKRQTLDGFDNWFNRNGKAAVLITRLLPIIRTIINFPAGFAKMSLRDFVLYSLAGMIVWDTVLMAYGYVLKSAIASNSISLILGSVGALCLVLYIVYKVARRSIK